MFGNMKAMKSVYEILGLSTENSQAEFSLNNLFKINYLFKTNCSSSLNYSLNGTLIHWFVRFGYQHFFRNRMFNWMSQLSFVFLQHLRCQSSQHPRNHKRI